MPPKRKQMSIKEALQAKRKKKSTEPEVEVDIDDGRIPVLPYFYLHNSSASQTVPFTNYKLSSFARIWFRENSNIDDVLKKYIESQKVENPLKFNYLNACIRGVMSNKYKYEYPYSIFRFNSDQDEKIGRLLITYPNIKNQEDLNDTHKYMNENRLKFCEVSMFKNNPIRDDIVRITNRRLDKYGPEESRRIYMNATRQAMTDFYQKNDQMQFYNLKDITPDTLKEISTFSRTCRKLMEVCEIPATKTVVFEKKTFERFKSNPNELYYDRNFFTHAKYYLVTNNLTKEQEIMIMVDKKAFAECTNAPQLVMEYKQLIEVDESLDSNDKIKERFEKFHKMYFRARDKKMPPFHNLHWLKEDADDYLRKKGEKEKLEMAKKRRKIDDDGEKIENGAHCSYQQPPTVVRNVAKEITPDKTEISSSSENNQTVINTQVSSSSQTNSLEEFITHPLLAENEIKIIKKLASNHDFIEAIKADLRNRFPDKFSELWTAHKKKIMPNFIAKIIRTGREEFEEFLTKFASTQLKESILDIIDFAELSLMEPSATSTQCVVHETNRSQQKEASIFTHPQKVKTQQQHSRVDSSSSHQQPSTSTAQQQSSTSTAQQQSSTSTAQQQSSTSTAQQQSSTSTAQQQSSTFTAQHQSSSSVLKRSIFQLDKSSLDDILLMPPPRNQQPEIPAVVTVKQEKLSEPIENNFNSDCVLLSQHEDPIILLSDEWESNNDLLSELEKNETDRGIFQKNLNVDSDKIEDFLPQSSNNNNNMSLKSRQELESYGLRTRQFDEQDRMQRLAAMRNKNSNVTTRKKNRGLQFINDDDDSDSTNSNSDGNIKKPDDVEMLSENFSIFLSTQLMLDYNRHNIEKTAMTFTKNPNNKSDDNNNNNNMKTCFLAELQHVSYQKDRNFEILINIPQYSLHDVTVKNDQIKEVLNLNDFEWKTLVHNLEIIETYEYNIGQNVRNAKNNGKDIEIFIAQNLDLYFSSLSKFKHFQLKSNDGVNFDFTNVPNTSRATDLTNAIDPNILKRIKSYKNVAER